MDGENKVGAVQFQIIPGDIKGNLLKAANLLEKTSKNNVRLVVFSEYCWVGFPDAKSAESMSEGLIIRELTRLAKKYQMGIITGSFVEKEGESLFSSNVLISSNGEIVGKQKKVHLLDKKLGGPIKDELGEGLKQGKSFDIFKTEFGNIGILTGSDVDPPEAARTLALKGADILAVSISGEIRWLDCIRYMAQTRAYENSVYVIVSNRVGKWEKSPVGDVMFAGNSMIVTPLGEIIASAGAYSERVAVAPVNVSRLYEMRKSFNILALRKKETYLLH